METQVRSAFRFIETKPMSGKENMEFDMALFADLEKRHVSTTIRFYSWSRPCVSLGYSQGPEGLLDVSKLSRMGWDVVKRPTGGGAAFHNVDEVAYSLVADANSGVLSGGLVASYRAISSAIISGLQKLGIAANFSGHDKHMFEDVCFSYPTDYEILASGKKLVGSAQKRVKGILLQHGSIFVTRISDEILSCVAGADIKKIQASYITAEDILGRKPAFDEVVSVLRAGFEVGFLLFE